MPSLPVLLALALVLALVYKYIVHPAFLSPLSRIPNAHFSTPFSSCWILWVRKQSRENRTLLACHARLGPIVRLAPSELSVNCVDDGLRTIYSGGFEKHSWYTEIFGNYGVPNMFSTAASKPHSIRKRMISNVYSKSYLQTSPDMHTISQVLLYDRLLPLIDACALSGEPIDVVELNFATAMDFITAYQFGLGSGSNFLADRSVRTAFLTRYHSRKRYTFWPQELPRLTALVQRLGIRLYPAFVDAANREIEAWCLKMCEAVPSHPDTDTNTDTDTDTPGDTPGDTAKPTRLATTAPVVYHQLAASLQHTLPKSNATSSPPHPIDLTLASEMLDHLAAGHETTGISLTYLMHELSRQPALQASLRHELLTLSPPILFPIPSSPLSPSPLSPSPLSPSPSSPSSPSPLSPSSSLSPSPSSPSPSSPPSPPLPHPKHLSTLPLLHALLLETLRLHAPIPGPQPRLVPAAGGGGPVTLAGYAGIPPRTRVSACAYALHRNGEVFEDPGRWRPGRWLDGMEDGEGEGEGGDGDERGDERGDQKEEDTEEDNDRRKEKESRRKEMMRWWWAFGSGGRGCVGRSFAEMEMNLLVAAIYTNYTTTIVDDHGIEQADAYTAGPVGNKLFLRFERVG